MVCNISVLLITNISNLPVARLAGRTKTKKTKKLMETQKASVKKIALPYGAVLGLITVLLSVIVYVMNLTYEQPWWQGALGFIAMIICIIIGIKTFKKDNGGFLSLGEALKVGLGISLIAGIFGVIYMLIFGNIIEPDFAANMLAATEDNMLEQNPNMTQEQIDMAMGISETMMSPLIISAMSMIMTLFFGFIISLITGLVMKVNRPAHM
tara:strand:- start:1754 stop:2383 length:630 start_codon:yes stop_codon:yes gene_type:complete